MIQIQDKYNCCGCSACAQRCPKQCIAMREDEEGFLYPHVDANTCIDCGSCEKVCPVINQSVEHKPLLCYAAKNPDEAVRTQSSSGGIFLPLAESIIREGGIVFGARFDNNWEVVHTSAENLEDLKPFQGSKYVQSKMGTSFKDAEQYLNEGRKVLFSGTPCQIAALHKYLRKEYDNLITVDVVCHGAPSPRVWRDYIVTLPMNRVAQVNMKDKRSGWRRYSFSLVDSDGKILLKEKASKNKYLMAFSRNLTLRPSCFSCPAKAGKSKSDITLADFWGIEKIMPPMDDNRGTSLVLCNSEKGKRLVDSLYIQKEIAIYTQAIEYNSCIYSSTNKPQDRESFMYGYRKKGVTCLFEIENYNIIKRVVTKVKNRLHI